MNFIKQNVELSYTATIGGYKSNGNWAWYDGTAWSYTNWRSGEPDSDNWLVMCSSSSSCAFGWYDVDSSSSSRYSALCQCDKP